MLALIAGMIDPDRAILDFMPQVVLKASRQPSSDGWDQQDDAQHIREIAWKNQTGCTEQEQKAFKHGCARHLALLHLLLGLLEQAKALLFRDGDTDEGGQENAGDREKPRVVAAPKCGPIVVHLDESDDYHELVMVAENEGEIPPNTSLMIVKAGDKEYEVRITSTEQKNAMVTFKYQK